MHELGLAMEVVDIVVERARGARVRKVIVEVGKLAAVFPDALSTCFSLAAEGTQADGAVLEIVELSGVGTCRSCGARVLADDPLAACACGGLSIAWSSGMELRVRAMEVA